MSERQLLRCYLDKDFLVETIHTLGEAIHEQRRNGSDRERELFRLMNEAVFSLERILDRWDEWEKCQ